VIPPPLLVEPMATLDRTVRREIGRALRGEGLSYGEIHALTAVPKSTIATWCRDVTLSDAQRSRISERTGSRPGVPRDTQWRRREEIERIRADARREVETLITDPFWTAGVALYWGEGSKTDRRLELANGDPAAIRLFMSWVRRYMTADPEWVAVISLHADNDVTAATTHWMRALGLPGSSFNRPFVKPDGTGHRKNHLPNGVCRLRLRASTDGWIRTLTWIDELAHRMGDPGLLVSSRPGR
jgi:hypothetical protein